MLLLCFSDSARNVIFADRLDGVVDIDLVDVRSGGEPTQNDQQGCNQDRSHDFLRLTLPGVIARFAHRSLSSSPRPPRAWVQALALPKHWRSRYQAYSLAYRVARAQDTHPPLVSNGWKYAPPRVHLLRGTQRAHSQTMSPDFAPDRCGFQVTKDHGRWHHGILSLLPVQIPGSAFDFHAPHGSEHGSQHRHGSSALRSRCGSATPSGERNFRRSWS